MKITLKPGKDRAVRQGYPWAFQNQIARADGNPQTGDVVALHAAGGDFLGRGFYHATSLIGVRLVTRDAEVAIDRAFFEEKLRSALALREAFFAGSQHYRLAYGESDGLPGTTLDRYGDVVAFTTLCYGMEQRREMLLDALEAVAGPLTIVERNDHPLRAKDDLPQSTGVLRGTYGGPQKVEEDGVVYEVDVLGGLKTGFFLDQRLNRQIVRRLAKGRRVLDVFCADGGFGLHAAKGGAASVRFLDSSQDALDRARRNAELSGLDASTLAFERADALEKLGRMVDEQQHYDLVVLDPPAFAKSRRHADEAMKAYQRINITGFQLLAPGGILATASCSQAVSEADFLKAVRYSARKAGVALRQLYRGEQSPDHPILDAMPETEYLKFYVFQVV